MLSCRAACKLQSLQEKARFFTIFAAAHVVATGIINFFAAAWYASDYEHAVMMSDGASVHLPLGLVVLTALGKGFMLPLVPIIYGWEPTSNCPIGLAIVLNSSLIALIAFCMWVKIKAAIRKVQTSTPE